MNGFSHSGCAISQIFHHIGVGNLCLKFNKYGTLLELSHHFTIKFSSFFLHFTSENAFYRQDNSCVKGFLSTS